MNNVINVCGLSVLAFTGLVALSLVLMHRPDSPLKTIAMRITAGGFALLAPVYVASPIDLMPEAILGPLGIFDDLAAIIAAYFAGRYAIYGDRKASEASPKQLP